MVAEGPFYLYSLILWTVILRIMLRFVSSGITTVEGICRRLTLTLYRDCIVIIANSKTLKRLKNQQKNNFAWRLVMTNTNGSMIIKLS